MKKNQAVLFSLWTAGILLCVLISFIALLFSACGKTEEAPLPVDTAPPASDEPAVTDTPEDPDAQATETPAPTESPAPTVRLEQTPDAGRAYLDKITFLGDSTTYGIGFYYDRGYTDLCPPSQVWTPASGTLTLAYHSTATIVYPPTGEEITIKDAAERAKPEILMITLGVNGVSFMEEDVFIEAYTQLVHNIQEVSPDTKIILNSIYPVAASYGHLDQINNEKIRAANGWVERIAQDTGCRFLNSFEAVVGEDGNLPESSQNGDGLHLTGEAFGTVMDYIRTHAYQ